VPATQLSTPQNPQALPVMPHAAGVLPASQTLLEQHPEQFDGEQGAGPGPQAAINDPNSSDAAKTERIEFTCGLPRKRRGRPEVISIGVPRAFAGHTRGYDRAAQMLLTGAHRLLSG